MPLMDKPLLPRDIPDQNPRDPRPIIASHPQIVASYLWNMFDFAVPTSRRGSVEARNMKGMITFDRKTRKDSFSLV